jgi:hypothetical protein
LSDDENESDYCKVVNVKAPTQPKQGTNNKKQKTSDVSIDTKGNNNDTKVAHLKTNNDMEDNSTYCTHNDDDRCELLAENDMKKKSTYCTFCDDDHCHDDRFGWFCIEQCEKYMKSGKGNINESHIFKVFQQTYTSVLCYEIRKRKFELSTDDVLLSVPTCMLSKSWTNVVNVLYSD